MSDQKVTKPLIFPIPIDKMTSMVRKGSPVRVRQRACIVGSDLAYLCGVDHRVLVARNSVETGWFRKLSDQLSDQSVSAQSLLPRRYAGCVSFFRTYEEFAAALDQRHPGDVSPLMWATSQQGTDISGWLVRWTQEHGFNNAEQREERMRLMRAMAGEMLPGEEPTEAALGIVRCNSCSLTLMVEAPGDADLNRLMALAMTGWTRDPSREHDNDLCPECSP